MKSYEVIVIGAGLNGLYQLYRLREAGVDVHLLESGSDVGGTWFWNRYPGARLDSESYTYGYFFSDELLDEWTWSEEFVGQPELERYYRYVADRFALRSNIDFDTTVTAATWREDDQCWELRTEAGELYTAGMVVSATGMLSAPQLPPYAGIETYAGEWYHTSRWPGEGVDLRGKRVAVIGTGSTGVQVIQSIAPEVESLTVFQRTPNWATPLNNRPILPERAAEIRRTATEIHALTQESPGGFVHSPRAEGVFEVSADERARYLEQLWSEPGLTMHVKNFRDTGTDRAANDVVTDFLREKIAARVNDPQTLRKLLPDYFYGMKRPVLENGYFEVYNRPNVTLVDVRTEPIERFVENGIRTADHSYELDVVIFATGFDAVTGALSRIDVHGAEGVTLHDWWLDGPRTFMGIAVHHFPNFFILGGPQGPGGNNPRSVEGQVDWVTECILALRRAGVRRIEATAGAEVEWIEHVNESVSATLLAESTGWAWGSNTPGKTRAFQLYVGGQPLLRRRMTESARNGYAGFTLGQSEENERGRAWATISR